MQGASGNQRQGEKKPSLRNRFDVHTAHRRGLKLDGQQQQQQQDANSTQPQEAKEGKQEWWWLAKLEPVLSLRSRKARKPLDVTISMPFSLDRRVVEPPTGGGGRGLLVMLVALARWVHLRTCHC